PDTPGGELRANLARHAAWLERHRNDVGGTAPPWLVEAVGGPFEGGREPADWSQWSASVRCTYRQLKPHMSSAQTRGGYKANRTTRLSELDYFRPRDPNFGLIVDGLALNLVGCAEDTGAAYRGQWVRSSVVERIK